MHRAINASESMRLAYLWFVILLVMAVLTRPSLADDGTLTVFAIRHAEKANTTRDASLSEVGVKRAKRLARMLSDAEIEHIHSTDFKRTRSTAAPSASVFGLKVKLYDPRKLQELIVQLRKAKGRHLVVGHTNTVLKTVEMLGGEPGFPMDEGSEFDRLYIVTVPGSGAVSTVLMRY